MQFNNKITIRVATEYDDYGVPSAYSEDTIKCAILRESKLNKADDNKRWNAYDMVVILSHRTYAPYSEVFENKTLEFISGGKNYEPARINQINNFSGKPKYYEIMLNQKLKGDE